MLSAFQLLVKWFFVMYLWFISYLSTSYLLGQWFSQWVQNLYEFAFESTVWSVNDWLAGNLPHQVFGFFVYIFLRKKRSINTNPVVGSRRFLAGSLIHSPSLIDHTVHFTIFEYFIINKYLEYCKLKICSIYGMNSKWLQKDSDPIFL